MSALAPLAGPRSTPAPRPAALPAGIDSVDRLPAVPKAIDYPPGASTAVVPPVPGTLLTPPADISSALADARAAGKQVSQEWFGNSVTTGLLDIPDFVRGRIAEPPDAAGTQKELAQMHQIEAAQTPAENDTALYFRDHGAFGMWHQHLKEFARGAGPSKAIAAASDLYGAMGSNLVASMEAKEQYKRDRPFLADPTLTPIAGRPTGKSYPSGHASSAYAAATVLGHHWPARADEFTKLAEQVAYSRVYGGVHYPSDIVAGAFIGSAVGNIFVGEGTSGEDQAAVGAAAVAPPAVAPAPVAPAPVAA